MKSRGEEEREGLEERDVLVSYARRPNKVEQAVVRG